MRISSRWTAAALAASLAVPVIPVTADEPEMFGFLCGFTSTNDTTGVIQQNPDVQFGELNGGPFFGIDVLADDDTGPSTDPGTGYVKLRCWIQVNNPANGGAGGPFATADCTFEGEGVAAGACQISYTAGATDNIYLCATAYARRGNIHKHFRYDDDDDPTNGEQCSLAISAGG